MKRFLAISLLSIYLFSTTELHQLLKLPFLVEHFIEHKEQNSQITLWEFLCLHYANGDLKDADYDKDMKLPFKSHDCCSAMSIVACVEQPIHNFCLSIRPQYIQEKSFSIPADVFFNSSFLASIWQPPRQA